MVVADHNATGGWQRLYHFLALFLILAAAAAHLFYLCYDCPLDLAPDEAHYWDWSRHLDWSYYSKGPLVAYLIRCSCDLLGPLAHALTGSEMPAVRFPAVVCGGLLLLSLYALTLQVFRSPGLGLAVVAGTLTLPAIAVGASLMTIDAPFTCCWGWALVAGHRAVFGPGAGTAHCSDNVRLDGGRRGAWALTGLLIGAGILAKYTMILWLPSLGLFLLTDRRRWHLLRRAGPWLALVITLTCCLPIVMWNINHGWVSFRHVSGLAGLQAPAGLRWHGPLHYVAGQAALLLGFWFVAWIRALVAYRPGRQAGAGIAYLWWMSAPTFGVFLLFSLKTGGGELNWPITAYLSGAILTAAWLAEHLKSATPVSRRLTAVAGTATCLVGLMLIVVLHDTRPVQPVLLSLSSTAAPRQAIPLRGIDPTCRLRGWRTLAELVDAIRDRVRAQGFEPVVAASGWTIPGELAFYCAGQPTVYSLGLALGERRSQYDLWRPNPVADPGAFGGRVFIIVGDGPGLREAFTHMEPAVAVIHRENGVAMARWTVVVAWGYVGFSPKTLARVGKDY